MLTESAGACVDRLTAALGVYHRHSAGSSTAPSDAGASLRRWLLRQSQQGLAEALTVTDGPWLALTLAMAEQRTHEVRGVRSVARAVLVDLQTGFVTPQGADWFFVDLEQPPSLRSLTLCGGEACDLPCVCYRKARGLCARLAGQQEAAAQLEALLRVSFTDRGVPHSLRVSPEACGDAPKLLALLDQLSWGSFLSRAPAWRAEGASHAGYVALGGGAGVRERWVETPWLQSLGFYSLAAFVVNRLEVALWARIKPAQRTKRPATSLPLPNAAARLDALPPLPAYAAHAAAARELAARLRCTAASSCDGADAWPRAKVALETALETIDALARLPPGRDTLPSSLLWQPMSLAASRAGSTLARCGAAAVRALENAAADGAAAALLAEEEASHQAEAAHAARRAAKRSRARDAQAKAHQVAMEQCVRQAAAEIAAHVLARVLAAEQLPCAAANAAAAGAALPRATSMPQKQRRALGWVPREQEAPPAARQPHLTLPPRPRSTDGGRRTPLERTASVPSLAQVRLRGDSCYGLAAESSDSPSPRHTPPPEAEADEESDEGAPWAWPHHGPIDLGAAFDASGFFWSTAREDPSGSARPPSRASSACSEDSSAGGWREGYVRQLLEAEDSTTGTSGVSSPLPCPQRRRSGTQARSVAGSPGSEAEAERAWADAVALRRNSTALPALHRQLAGSATSSPRRAHRGSSLERRPPHAPARPAPQQAPAAPQPAPLSMAPGAAPRLPPALLRRVVAPAFACAHAPCAYADAAARRAAFWAQAGAAGEAAASRLTDQVSAFARDVEAAAFARRPARVAAVQRVTRALQDLWPRACTRVFGSEAAGLSLPTSDVDMVVALPPVRQLPPIEEAGILEGRNGINESVLKQAARQLTRQEWTESAKCIESTAVPLITLTVRGQPGDALPVRLDLSFDGPRHQGLATAELVRSLVAALPVLTPLTLVLKQFLSERSLHHAYTGGLSSYCLVLLLAAYLKHAAAAGAPCGPPPSLGVLLADVLHFYGRDFDPRRSAVALAPEEPHSDAPFPAALLFPGRGGREALIDVLHISDPLGGVHTNVGRNCFRFLQIQKALGDASRALDAQLAGGEGPLLEGLICTRVAC